MKTPLLYLHEEDTIEDIFQRNEILVYNRCLEAIKYGVKHNKDCIDLFELSPSGNCIGYFRIDWKQVLNQCMLFFEETEEYEKCTICLGLKREIDVKNGH